MKRHLAAALLFSSMLILAACKAGDPAPAPSQAASGARASGLDARDGQQAAGPADSEARPIMQAQVVLDRIGFTPGVVDGKMGLSTRNAIAGFQEANGLPVTGELDEATAKALVQWQSIPATRVITIPADFAAGPFVDLPDRPAEQSRLAALGYETLDEKLAERLHTTIETLVALNAPPAATGASKETSSSPSAAASAAAVKVHFAAGQQIRVPNVGNDRVDTAQVKDAGWAQTLIMLGVGSAQPQAKRIVVSKSKGTMKVYDKAEKLVAVYTATMGSEHDPLPLGEWKVNGTSYNPEFHYNPKLFWDARRGERAAMLPPGPNGPVGVVWIDLSKPHYGIHGTPHPETIGRAESHGCVRLTNWDVARLAQMVHSGT
ncbi:MAG: L,D-transpeptidase family protein, partial [Novosphingobium sp.]